MNKQIAALLGCVLKEPSRNELLKKHIDVSRYPVLSEEILDDVLEIDEVFLETELDEISDRFKEYLADYSVLPFLGIVGGNVVCVGISSTNSGRVFYYDFDFGIFELDESIDDFVNALQPDRKKYEEP